MSTDPAGAPGAGADVLDPGTHRKMGVDLSNHVWRLLEAEERSVDDEDEMVHAAHASRWHWSRSAASDLPQRLAVGEWQLAGWLFGQGHPAGQPSAWRSAASSRAFVVP